MDKKRLLKLAKYLREVVPANRFNLNFWVNTDNSILYKDKKPLKQLKCNDNVCGYAGCAAGWACSIFKNLELRKHSDKWLLTLSDYYVYNKKTKEYGYKALADFFNITESCAEYLFSPFRYPKDHRGKISVAKRIERFVETNGECYSDREYW